MGLERKEGREGRRREGGREGGREEKVRKRERERERERESQLETEYHIVALIFGGCNTPHRHQIVCSHSNTEPLAYYLIMKGLL